MITVGDVYPIHLAAGDTLFLTMEDGITINQFTAAWAMTIKGEQDLPWGNEYERHLREDDEIPL